jgi:hypothetical protein
MQIHVFYGLARRRESAAIGRKEIDERVVEKDK